MGDPVLQLNNANNWQSIYYQSHTATVIGLNSHTPIPEITIPILFDSHIIAALITSSTAQPHWRFAGWLNQRIALGLTVGGSPDSDAIQPRKLYLDRIALLRFPRLTSHYSVSINIAKWHQEATIQLWEYTGIRGDTTEDMIELLKQDVLRVEGKVDAL